MNNEKFGWQLQYQPNFVYPAHIKEFLWARGSFYRFTHIGKGSKERILPFSARTGQVLWRYLATRKDAEAGEYVFITKENLPLDRGQLLHLVVAIENRVGLQEVNVHRFRRTFAINYLRNGGDPWSLH